MDYKIVACGLEWFRKVQRSFDREGKDSLTEVIKIACELVIALVVSRDKLEDDQIREIREQLHALCGLYKTRYWIEVCTEDEPPRSYQCYADDFSIADQIMNEEIAHLERQNLSGEIRIVNGGRVYKRAIVN